jgi:RecB family endonuclease NucS
MNPPLKITELAPDPDEAAEGISAVWLIRQLRSDDALRLALFEVDDDLSFDLGEEPGLVKDGVEAHLQALLAEQAELVGPGLRLVRREYPTPTGPGDLLLRDPGGGTVVVEDKRRGDIDGVEQLTRYVELLKRDSTLGPVRGVLAAQLIRPQAQVLAQDRGIECLLLDYAAMRGAEDSSIRLF